MDVPGGAEGALARGLPRESARRRCRPPHQGRTALHIKVEPPSTSRDCDCWFLVQACHFLPVVVYIFVAGLRLRALLLLFFISSDMFETCPCDPLCNILASEGCLAPCQRKYGLRVNNRLCYHIFHCMLRYIFGLVSKLVEQARVSSEMQRGRRVWHHAQDLLAPCQTQYGLRMNNR